MRETKVVREREREIVDRKEYRGDRQLVKVGERMRSRSES